MAAQVRRGLVLFQQGAEPVQQTGCGSVTGDRPHGVVARHQQEVRLGESQPLPQPAQLLVGLQGIQRRSGLLIREVVGVPTQLDGVQHEDGQRLPRVGNPEVQLVVESRKPPTNWERVRIVKNASESAALDLPLTIFRTSGCTPFGHSRSLRGHGYRQPRTRGSSETSACTHPQTFAEKRSAAFNPRKSTFSFLESQNTTDLEPGRIY